MNQGYITLTIALPAMSVKKRLHLHCTSQKVEVRDFVASDRNSPDNEGN